MKTYRLKNGLRLRYKRNKINKATGIRISFDCGASADGDLFGLAHFCEHMFFTGTDSQTKDEITNEYYDFINVNAFTNYSIVAFCGTVFTHELGRYLECVAKMITKSRLGEKEVEDEKKVVLQEIVRASAKYEAKSSLNFDSILYNNNGMEYGALGNLKSVQKITCEEVKGFIKKYFISNNCTISIYTPLKFDEVKNIIEKKFINNINYNSNFIPKEENLTMIENSVFKLKQLNIDKNYLYFAFRSSYGVKSDFDLACLHILTGIMSNFKYGIMNEMRLKKSLTYYADFTFEINKDNSPIIFSTECSKDNVKECLNVLANYIKNLVENGVSQEQLNKQIREEIYYFETLEKTVSKEINKIYNAGKYKVVEDNKILELMKKVTIENLNTMIKEIFINPTFACLVYGDAKNKDVYTLKELKKMFIF